jgi:hypothetical protein
MGLVKLRVNLYAAGKLYPAGVEIEDAAVPENARCFRCEEKASDVPDISPPSKILPSPPDSPRAEFI